MDQTAKKAFQDLAEIERFLGAQIARVAGRPAQDDHGLIRALEEIHAILCEGLNSLRRREALLGPASCSEASARPVRSGIARRGLRGLLKMESQSSSREEYLLDFLYELKCLQREGGLPPFLAHPALGLKSARAAVR